MERRLPVPVRIPAGVARRHRLPGRRRRPGRASRAPHRPHPAFSATPERRGAGGKRTDNRGVDAAIRRIAADSVALKQRFFAENAELLVDGRAGAWPSACAPGGKVLVFGNGGSAADAQHFAGGAGGPLHARPAGAWPPSPSPPTRRSSPRSATTSASTRCSAARSRRTAGPGDVAVGITHLRPLAQRGRGPPRWRATSGLLTVGMTGGGGGRLRGLVDYLIDVPHDETPRIQEVHGDGRPRPLPDRRGGDRRLMRATPGRRARRSRWRSTASRTYPLASARARSALGDFARPHAPGATCRRVPRVAAPPSWAARRCARSSRDILRARSLGKPIVWGLGRARASRSASSPVLIDLMERGLRHRDSP